MHMNHPESIPCVLNNDALLYRAYMPFIIGGGLFVCTNHAYCLGDQVFLSVQLMDDPVCYLIEGIVRWITPIGALENKPAGIGVQFLDEKGPALCHKIESHLASLLKSTQMTDTM